MIDIGFRQLKKIVVALKVDSLMGVDLRCLGQLEKWVWLQ